MTSLSGIIAVEHVSDGLYRARPLFDRGRQGNSRPIAYGGIALGQAISAGQHTIPQPRSPSSPPFYLYSVQGTYLGPASTDVATTYRVEEHRSTRTFITRQVIASQTIRNPKTGKEEERKVLIVMMDWHVLEPHTLLEYSSPPMYPLSTYSRPLDLPPQAEYLRSISSESVARAYEQTFPLFTDLFDSRYCPHSMGSYDMYGFRSPNMEGPEDRLDLHKRTSSRWTKVTGELQGESEQTAAVGFLMDGALAFLPLTFTKHPLSYASAVSSLDFSLRFFRPTDLTKWHLSEQHTESGGNARTYSVGRLWDEQGREVAVMSQASVLRPRVQDGGDGPELKPWDAREGSRVLAKL